MGNEEGQRVGERLGHGRPVEEKIGFLGQWGGGAEIRPNAIKRE
jgi:hypothetical protein